MSAPDLNRKRWSYREMSRAEKRRIVEGFGMCLSAIGISLALLSFAEDSDVPWLKEDKVPWLEPALTILAVSASGALLFAFGLLAVLVRPSRTVMQVVDDRLEFERQLMVEQLCELRRADALHMEKWKNDTVSQLFAMVMDQVNRGVITCEKCAESDAALCGQDQETATEKDEGGCRCSGPSSLAVLYTLPRFQPKSIAS